MSEVHELIAKSDEMKKITTALVVGSTMEEEYMMAVVDKIVEGKESNLKQRGECEKLQNAVNESNQALTQIRRRLNTAQQMSSEERRKRLEEETELEKLRREWAAVKAEHSPALPKWLLEDGLKDVDLNETVSTWSTITSTSSNRGSSLEMWKEVDAKGAAMEKAASARMLDGDIVGTRIRDENFEESWSFMKSNSMDPYHMKLSSFCSNYPSEFSYKTFDSTIDSTRSSSMFRSAEPFPPLHHVQLKHHQFQEVVGISPRFLGILSKGCAVCGLKGRLHWKCKECGIMAHWKCKMNVALPCGKGFKVGEVMVMETKQSIPVILYRCVEALENHGLEETAYEKEDADSQKRGRALLSKLTACRNVLMHEYDDATICHCLKLFIASYDLIEEKDGVVLKSMLCEGYENAYAVSEWLRETLDPAKRTTLAFFMLHLQRVADKKGAGSSQRLAEILGPFIFGGSSEEDAVFMGRGLINVHSEIYSSVLQ